MAKLKTGCEGMRTGSAVTRRPNLRHGLRQGKYIFQLYFRVPTQFYLIYTLTKYLNKRSKLLIRR